MNMNGKKDKQAGAIGQCYAFAVINYEWQNDDQFSVRHHYFDKIDR